MNDYIAVEYQLFVKGKDDEDEQLQELRTEEQPFVFISNMNAVLPAFENSLALLNKEDKIDFYIKPEEAFGAYRDDLIFELPIENFYDNNGYFDDNVYSVGNIIGLKDQHGNLFNAVIRQIDNSNITVDLNHPRAGLTLHFIGKVLERRNATKNEIDEFLAASKKCGGCGGCGGSCNSGCSGGCC